MTRPLVSIVTPSYNYGRYIGSCLASVRRQTYPAIEHLVLDACSTDDTGRVLAAFAGTYPLQVTVGRDGGQADAIERGLAAARGDVLCWLNADDYYLHERVVEEAVAALDDGADVVTGGGAYVDEREVVVEEIAPNYGMALERLPYVDTLLQPATFWRRRVHRPLRRDMHYAFDWRLFLDMREAGARFRVVDGRWAAYRRHAVNKTSVDPARRRGEIARIFSAEFGALSPQHLWGRVIQAGFVVAEAVRVPRLKVAVRLVNEGVRVASRGRVYSP